MKFLRKYLLPVLFLILCCVTYGITASSTGIPFHRVSGGINTSMVVDNKVRTIPLPYGHAIAEGIIANHIGLNKFGHNGNVGTTEEVVWPLSDGHAYLSAAETLQVSSSDVDDTAAGTGARTVLLTGQTTGFIEITETVTLNGTSSVETTSSFLRIYRASVITAGASLTNEGLISIKDNADTVTLAQVVAGRGQSQMAFWTVPAGQKAFIPQIHAAETNNKKVTVRLYARDNTVTDAAWQLRAEIGVNLSDVPRNTFIPLVFTEKTDIELRAVAGLTGGDVLAGFSLYYEPE